MSYIENSDPPAWIHFRTKPDENTAIKSKAKQAGVDVTTMLKIAAYLISPEMIRAEHNRRKFDHAA